MKIRNILAVVLSLILVFSIIGCTEAQNENQNNPSSTTSSENAVSSKEEGVKLKDGTIIYREGGLSTNALIEFKDENDNVLLATDDIFKVSAKYIEPSGYVIQLDFNEAGTEKLKKATEENIGKTINIYIDNQLILSPIVNGVIIDGKVIVTDYDFDKEKIYKIYDSLTK